MKTFNSCDEVLNYLVNIFGTIIEEDIVFEGSEGNGEVEWGFALTNPRGTVLISKKWEGHIFFIDDKYGFCVVSVLPEGSVLEECLSVMLPVEKYNELVATILGKW